MHILRLEDTHCGKHLVEGADSCALHTLLERHICPFHQKARFARIRGCSGVEVLVDLAVVHVEAKEEHFPAIDVVVC